MKVSSLGIRASALRVPLLCPGQPVFRCQATGARGCKCDLSIVRLVLVSCSICKVDRFVLLRRLPVSGGSRFLSVLRDTRQSVFE